MKLQHILEAKYAHQVPDWVNDMDSANKQFITDNLKAFETLYRYLEDFLLNGDYEDGEEYGDAIYNLIDTSFIQKLNMKVDDVEQFKDVMYDIGNRIWDEHFSDSYDEDNRRIEDDD